MKKGFTLIELLAVIVILAIIALIATPIILGIIEDARKGSIEASANGYIDAVEYQIARNEIKGTETSSGVHDVINLDVDIEGSKPSRGTVKIEEGKIIEANLCIDGYNVVYEKGKSKVKETCGKPVLPKVGNYVKMTPTSTSFTTDTAKTGYTETQTINPSELNLWRVIKVNSDGTIEIVSEYVSSTSVYFQGQTGYKNLVGYLNEIAKQYENSKYTIRSRYMGYSTQTEYLIDTANTVDSTATTPPWTSDTGKNTVESQGGGDYLYATDTNLVEKTIGTLKATNLSGITTTYWIASRYYNYGSSTIWNYSGRYVSTSGPLNSNDLYLYINNFNDNNSSHAIRPIVILKSGISYPKAEGTVEDPFVLE